MDGDEWVVRVVVVVVVVVIEEDVLDRESHCEIRVLLKELRRVCVGLMIFLKGTWMPDGGRGGEVVGRGGMYDCGSSLIDGNSSIILFAGSKAGLGSGSSTMGLRAWSCVAWGGSPGRELQRTGWLFNPSQALPGR